MANGVQAATIEAEKPSASKSKPKTQTAAQKLRRAELLLHVSRTIAGIDTLDEVLETLVNIAMNETGAERGTLFLNDETTNELYSRVTQGEYTREIRLLNNSGVAGAVFQSGRGEIIHDAYEDKRFNHTIDKQTGYTTRSILCVPIRTVKGEVIGVAQLLNKIEGDFTEDNQSLLEAITTQAAVALQSAQFAESMKKSRLQELAFLDMVADITSEIDLGQLLKKVMGEATTMLNAERSTLFLNDEKTNELWSQVGEGLETTQIRFPNHLGIAGTVFTSGESVNIRHAYADLRFNPAFDKQTGYFTRSILCVPVVNKDGKTIGVTQILNKKGGPFTDEDESRLKAFTAQVSIGLENAKLFDDVQNMKNYNESMLESMSNGVITMDDARKIVTCNAAGLKIFQVAEEDIIGKQAEEFFLPQNDWLIDQIDKVEETQEQEHLMDEELKVGDEPVSVNLTALPLVSSENKKLGTMFMIEDISSEKRVKSTMARYMDADLADQLLGKGEELLGGANIEATLLFSDIRGFTPLTEELGAQGTVSLLNEYFTIMVDCIQQEGGMLDKFIGDAIMAAFGIPVAHDDDPDRAMRTAIKMITDLHDFNKDRTERGLLPVNIGIGLNTDTVVSGNIGSPKRMDYTVIGDGVNLAARLESACKQYKAQILVSENTVNQLKGTYRVRDVDDVVVKGKTQPVRIYEVLDYHTDESFPNLMDTVNYFNEGRKLYHKGDFKKSIAAFQEALKANPDDGLSEIYIGRCEHLMEHPKEGGWDGVWVMTSK